MIRYFASVSLFCLLTASPPTGHAQEAPSPPAKWEKEIAKFEASEVEKAPPKNANLFVGSSSIRLWNLEASFPNLPTINRGFGGSEVSDSLHFAKRIILPHKPKRVFIYAGDNDIAKGKTAQTVFKDFVALVDLIHAELPDTQIIFVAIKPSLKRWELWPEMRRANDMVVGYATAKKLVSFADIATPMIGKDGKPMADLLAKDQLHLTKKGYAAWNAVIQPFLQKKTGKE